MKRTLYSLLLLTPLFGACSHAVTRPLSVDREIAEPAHRFMAIADTSASSQFPPLQP
ncbi:hypothetical protein LRS06_03150 [Hymenobacter sp. J193]|uniref:hypothetical protein n=1 Tax=Hymenobacter sp. J193 TaxID=2898429 RepID=UPI002151E6C9|nr:hypothetical protein [Hymenobacter sp. J193]MCR5886786.1 hypothetical protein [Hymenobacter sp. J193]